MMAPPVPFPCHRRRRSSPTPADCAARPSAGPRVAAAEARWRRRPSTLLRLTPRRPRWPRRTRRWWRKWRRCWRGQDGATGSARPETRTEMNGFEKVARCYVVAHNLSIGKELVMEGCVIPFVVTGAVKHLSPLSQPFCASAPWPRR